MPRSKAGIAVALGSIVLLFFTIYNLVHLFGPSRLYYPKESSSTRRLPLTESQQSPQIPLQNVEGDQYLLGVGRGDITGPVVEINLMGYADPDQLGSGLRQRLYSRAFIFGHVETPEDRFVYLVLDTQSGDTAIRHGILNALAERGGEYALYGQHNVAVTATHSHSGPGAWLNYLLPQITSRGFHKPSYQAIVDGAVESIVSAHESLAPGRLSIGTVDVLDASINRSPYSYQANPESERKRYKYDTDKTMTVLRFSHGSGSRERNIGVLTWFALHGTSLQANNTLITGDNKGVAARLFEEATTDPGFVAAFSQANVGDTSPNILGAYCEYGDDEGLECDFKTSLCGNKTQPCHGRGPYYGRNDGGAASAFEIGRRQYAGAWELFTSGTSFTPISGQIVKGVHQFVDFSTYSFTLPNGTVVNTCPAAMGYSFAAGTSDGPGAFDFKQAQPNDPNASPLWKVIGNRIHTPNDTQKACHGAKVILLDVGESDYPYAWSPNIVDIQMLRVGNLFIVVAPGEVTTMSGRRWREAVHASIESSFPEFNPNATSAKPIVLLGGPANTYTHYITTEEEYGVQRYEGASTLYGPHTLAAHISLSLNLLPHLSPELAPAPLPKSPLPPITINDSLSFITPVVVDTAPLLKAFGAVHQDVQSAYQAGDTVAATFVGACPRNNHRAGKTFAAVQQYDFASKSWRTVRDDADWSLVFEWRRTSTMLGTSVVTVSWETKWETGDWRDEGDAGAHTHLPHARKSLRGLYRLKYYGDAKSWRGAIAEFEGTSAEFRIV